METERKVIDLGWCLARIKFSGNSYAPDGTMLDFMPEQLTIVSPACEDDGLYSPTASIEINGKENIEKLRDGFIVLDGKYHVNKYVKEDQLHFYVCLLGLRYQKQAYKVGFIDWSDAKIKLFDVKLDFLEQLRSEISILIENGSKIEKYLKDLRSREKEVSSFYEIEGIEFKPSKDNCIFCPINTSCKYYEHQGDDSLEKHMEDKKKTEQHIESLNLNIGDINTITI